MPSHGQSYGLGLPKAIALMAGDSQPKCSYCRRSRSSSSCTVVTDVMQRKNILKKDGRCFVCLKRHHLSRDCRSPIKCACCNGQHHTSICKGHANAQQCWYKETRVTMYTEPRGNTATKSRATKFTESYINNPVVLRKHSCSSFAPDSPGLYIQSKQAKLWDDN